MSAWREGAFRVGAWRAGSWRGMSQVVMGQVSYGGGGGGGNFRKWWEERGIDLDIDALAQRMLHPELTREVFAPEKGEELFERVLPSPAIDMRLVDLMVASIKRRQRRQQEEEIILQAVARFNWL